MIAVLCVCTLQSAVCGIEGIDSSFIVNILDLNKVRPNESALARDSVVSSALQGLTAEIGVEERIWGLYVTED